MSHEMSITIKHEGSWYNIPSVIKGKRVSDDKAVAHHVENKTLGKAYETVKDAVSAAKKRSQSFDKGSSEAEKLKKFVKDR